MVDPTGAALGAAFSELFGLVKPPVMNIAAFRSQLQKIKATLVSIEPIIKDIEFYEPDRGLEEMAPIKELLDEGKRLVDKCKKIHALNLFTKYKHSKRLTAFNAAIVEEFQLCMPLLGARDAKEMSVGVKGIGEDVKEIGGAVKELKEWFVRVNGRALQSELETSSDLAVPAAPDFIVGSEVEASKSASPMHHKSLVENSTAWRESNVQAGVHPLPRPPGAALPSHSPHNAQVTVKTESLPLKGQWQKGRLIGRGSFGSVYVASNRETGALCAMKEVELLPDDPKSAECMRQLEQEIKVLSRLKHRNIVQYYGSEIVEDRFYIYLEYVHPGSINKYVRDHCGAITESVVCNFTQHILSGLAYLHSQKTIHRDIKGANLLVDASGIVKLADFGMAKHLTGQKADLSLKGSPHWLAPELIQAKMQKDNGSDHALAVDIWSLGCTIVEMLTGKPPWSEFEGAAAMFKAMKNSPSIPETLSSEGKDFLQRCFRRNPAERPSAAKLLEHPFLKSSQQIDIPPHT